MAQLGSILLVTSPRQELQLQQLQLAGVAFGLRGVRVAIQLQEPHRSNSSSSGLVCMQSLQRQRAGQQPQRLVIRLLLKPRGSLLLRPQKRVLTRRI
jgi:hypothetical protein